jgi:predicted RNase H-like HicB family nuclease
MKKEKFTSLVWKEGRYYVAQCLNVDISSFGVTKKAALKNLEEAVDLYFQNTSKPKISVVEKFELKSRVLVNA